MVKVAPIGVISAVARPAPPASPSIKRNVFAEAFGFLPVKASSAVNVGAAPSTKPVNKVADAVSTPVVSVFIDKPKNLINI